jgi:hypothetical protein
MSHAYLNASDAAKAWVLRECGWKVRDIGKRFDVDPRRLYEVWEETEHKGSRFKAMKLFLRKFPTGTLSGRFEVHRPMFKRTLRDSAQPLLPGI